MFRGTVRLGPRLDVSKMLVLIRLLQQSQAFSNLIAVDARILNPAKS